MTKTLARRWTAAAAVAALTVAGAVSAGPAAAAAAAASAPALVSASAAPLTNLAHLDFLLDTATPAGVAGHSTYNLDTEPALTMPWTYADARPGGTFERVGGGPLDPATGYWGQGAYNSDDITRASVVYLRDWKQTGALESRQKAYELLRSVAYFQTTTGANAGNLILWMQPDGTFNASPEPVELPDPSDSGESYWLARSLWAFGEGYAAFQKDDPEFAAFLQQRLQLGVSALERQSLSKYGTYSVADGVKVPAWLIVDGADASAEAVLGLSAYSAAAPADTAARTALSQLAEGVALMAAGDTRTWPYGAILPWAQSRSMFHSWGSMMPAALAEASVTLGRPDLLTPAVTDSVSFTTTLLTAGGPDNGWFPTPTDKVQIAYGADSRLQSLLAVADASGSRGIGDLAGLMGAWFFGMNKSGAPVYDPATGVTFDGVQADGTVNRNSGAESTIHGQLTMIALDGHPDVAARAITATQVTQRSGLEVVEAESSTSTTGSVTTPPSAWTGESLFSGGAYLALDRGETATIPLAVSDGLRHVEPVTYQPNPGSAMSLWRADRLPIGVLKHHVGDQGITAAPGALLPQTLLAPVSGRAQNLEVRALTGEVQLDAVITRPFVSRLTVASTSGASMSTQLVQSTSVRTQQATIGTADVQATIRSYDARGVLVEEREVAGVTSVRLAPGGFAVAVAG